MYIAVLIGTAYGVPNGTDSVKGLNFMTDPEGNENTRRHEILDAGLAVLVEKGWKGTSMLAIARKSNASKETLYNWFGDKSGFFEALIRRNAAALDRSISAEMSLEEGLASFGRALLTLLMGEASVALNRAAIAQTGSDDRLGALLVAQGRAASMPVLGAFLNGHAAAGRLAIDDMAEAGETYLGMVKGDWQILRLLGVMPEPERQIIDARARDAARKFVKLYGS